MKTRLIEWLLLCSVLSLGGIACGSTGKKVTKKTVTKETVTIPAALPHEKVVNEEFRTRVLTEAGTHNACPKGLERLNGQWSFAGDTRAKGFRNRLVFRGASFTEFLVGGESATEHGIIRGSYRCIDGGRLVFYVDTVEPEGAFENHSKDIYSCLILWGMGELDGHLMLRCNFGWDPKKELEFVYASSGR